MSIFSKNKAMKNESIKFLILSMLLLSCKNSLYKLDYSILGGSLGGLKNGTVVIQNSDGVTLSLTKNGNFEFPEPYPNSTQYEMKIISSPIGHLCSLLNARGAIDYDHELTIGIRCFFETTSRASDKQTGDSLGSSIAIYKNTAIVGAANEDGGAGDPASGSGAAYVFTKNNFGAWTQTQILRASDFQANDSFGLSVAIYGNLIMVSATREDGGSGDPLPNSGAVYIFNKNNSGVWQENQILRSSDIQASDQFGYSISLLENIVTIGAPNESGGAGDPLPTSGTAYIFEKNSSGIWSETVILRASDKQIADNFGWSVSMTESTTIISAPDEDGGLGDPMSNSGAVYVFEKSSSAIWTEKQILRSADIQPEDSFGFSISISRNLAIIGAPFEDGGLGDLFPDSGVAYLFEKNSSGLWVEKSILRSNNISNADQAGMAVSIFDQTAVVGVRRDDGSDELLFNSGAAHIFSLDKNNIWQLLTTLRASDKQGNDFFGSSVAINKENIGIGAIRENGGAGDPFTNSGAVYFFEK